MNRNHPVRTVFLGTLFALAARGAWAGHYSWTTNGPEPGTVYQIVIDSADSASLFTVDGFWGSYLFRTGDRGVRWDFVEGAAGLRSIVPDPSRSGAIYAVVASDVWRTADGGRNWRAGSIDGATIAALALAPSSPDTLYAVTGAAPARLHRSTDAGATWTLVNPSLPGPFANLAVDPVSPGVLYSAVYTGLARSSDGGVTWNPSNTGLPSSAAFLRFDPRTPSRIYAATSDSGVYVSADSGATWNPANYGLEWHDVRDLAIDPANPARLIAATVGSLSPVLPGGLFVSIDSGASWAPVDLGIPGLLLGTAIAIDPRDSNRVYAGVGSSALRGNVLASADGGATWSVVNDGLSGYPISAVAAPSGLPGTALGISGSRVYETPDGGSSWSLLTGLQYAMTALLADPSSPATLYAEYSQSEIAGVYKSVDGGSSWVDASVGLTGTDKYRIAIGISDPQTLLVSADDGIFETTNGGVVWTSILGGGGRGVAVDPADPLILYAGRATVPGLAGFVRSDDGGATWSVPGGMPFVEATGWDVRVDPSRPAYVYAAIANRVMRSVDRGLTFSASDTGIVLPAGPIFRLVLDPSTPSTLFAATSDSGLVFRSGDSAQTWSPIPPVPALTLTDLSVSATGRTLYAATSSGVFQFERSYVDVPDTMPAWRFIDAAALNGLTAGCGHGAFCPNATLTRAQAAVFLVKAARGAAFVPPPATGSTFADVPAGSFAAAWIEELAREGVTGGCGASAFCPGDLVSRAQMAVFLLRAKHGSTYAPPPATGTVFADVPAGSFAAAWIEELFHEGFAAGCGGGNFCGPAPATRAQAVTLLVAAFGLR